MFDAIYLRVEQFDAHLNGVLGRFWNKQWSYLQSLSSQAGDPWRSKTMLKKMAEC